jgi:sugar phosphate isomerase/epimerase
VSPTIERRQFFRQAALATAAASGVAQVANSAWGIEPFARNGQPKFKFSLAAYSYRDLLTGEPAELTLADFVDDCAQLGLEGTELTSYYFPQAVTDADLRTLKQQCFQLGLTISGTAVGNDFGYAPGVEREQQIASVKKWIDRAEILGAPVIRIFAGKQKKNQSPEVTHRLMVDGIEECCDYAGQHGVHLALENHGGPTATPKGLLRFIRDVRSPWFGVNLDTGNFYTEDPYGDLEQVAPYALNVQVKVVTALGEKRTPKRPTDFPRLVRILRDVNYRGFVVLEYEEGGDPRVECPKYVEQMRNAFAT